MLAIGTLRLNRHWEYWKDNLKMKSNLVNQIQTLKFRGPKSMQQKMNSQKYHAYFLKWYPMPTILIFERQ